MAPSPRRVYVRARDAPRSAASATCARSAEGKARRGVYTSTHSLLISWPRSWPCSRASKQATHGHVSKSSTQLGEVGQHTQLGAVPRPGGGAEAVSLRVPVERVLPQRPHQLQHPALQRADTGTHCRQQRTLQLLYSYLHAGKEDSSYTIQACVSRPLP